MGNKLNWLATLAIETWSKGKLMTSLTKKEIISELETGEKFFLVSQIEYLKEKWKDDLW